MSFSYSPRCCPLRTRMNCWQFDSLQHRATSIGMRHRYRSRRGEVKLLLLAEPQSAGPAWRRVLAGWRGLQIIDPGTRKLRPLAEERSPEISSCARSHLNECSHFQILRHGPFQSFEEECHFTGHSPINLAHDALSLCDRVRDRGFDSPRWFAGSCASVPPAMPKGSAIEGILRCDV